MIKLVFVLGMIPFFATVLHAADGAPATTRPAPSKALAPLPVILLKADDLTRAGASKNPVSARWQAFADFIESRKIKASIGIIGFALEEDHPDFFEWIQARDKKGFIEFWNHGYKYRVRKDDPQEFAGNSLEDQKKALGRTQKLAREKLGIELKAFGPHYSFTDAATAEAIKAFPEITVWFGGPDSGKVEGSSPLVLLRVANLEYPTCVPNFEKFKKDFENFRKWGLLKPYLYLTGHPNQWDEKRFAEFVKVVDYLADKGCVFMTASEYLESCRKAPATAPAKD